MQEGEDILKVFYLPLSLRWVDILWRHWCSDVPEEQRTGHSRFFSLGTLSPSTTSHLCHGILWGSLLMLRACQGSLEFVDHPWLFLVQKEKAGWHLVFDLSSLNGYIYLTKSKMEMVSSVLRLVRKGDFVFSIDFKDAYLQILIHQDS